MTAQQRVEALLASGELQRVMAECKTWSAAAHRLEINEDTLRSALSRIRKRGGEVPSMPTYRPAVERAATFRQPSNIGNSDEVPESGTEIPSAGIDWEKWPSLAAFDEPPLPVVGEGFHVRGKSTLVRDDGSIAAQWIKTSRHEPSPAEVIAAFTVAANDEIPRADPSPGPSWTNEDLLSAYLIGDSHIGMHAWSASAGSNFDLKIAEAHMLGAIDKLARVAPESKYGLILNAGDYTHSDGRANQTTKGTPVDVDGRWPKVLETALRIMRRIVARALERHDHVTLINEIGNHDTNTAIYLGLALSMYYENDPRVHVDTSPQFFHWYRFGKVLIGSHHGHLVKPQDLPGVMACDRAQDWGETEFRYFFNGHVHHERVREYRGCIVEHLRSPAPSDDWHHGQGYRSGHDIKLDVFDRNKGRIVRHTVGIEAAA